MKSNQILVVGAGFAGAVHARLLAEAGYRVDVIDRRNHIAGNCFDEVDSSGVRVHRYGPHLFHTSNRDVVDWLSRFTMWLPYTHRVKARLQDGRTVPLPVNRTTINEFFRASLVSPEEIMDYLGRLTIPNENPKNAEEYLLSTIGPELTETFYERYTRKMWARSLKETPASVVRRVQIRYDDEDRYFPHDSFQAMPKDGYASLFARIFSHENISISTSTEFEKSMEAQYEHVFNSMAIDEYFDECFGRLPYRSVKFHHFTMPRLTGNNTVTLNYTDTSHYTRETWWHNIPGHDVRKGPFVIKTVEEPCDPTANQDEKYYPAPVVDGSSALIYKRYKREADAIGNVTFIGRCGTYQYLDMHQVINQSFVSARKWLQERPAD